MNSHRARRCSSKASQRFRMLIQRELETATLSRSSTCFHFNACVSFEGLDQGGGVFLSEAKRNGRCEIFFGNTQRWNRRLKTFSKSFNEVRVLEHKLKRKAG